MLESGAKRALAIKLPSYCTTDLTRSGDHLVREAFFICPILTVRTLNCIAILSRPFHVHAADAINIDNLFAGNR
jgi:hypothetical protein